MKTPESFAQAVNPKRNTVVALNHPNGYLKGESRIERVWSHWKKLVAWKKLVLMGYFQQILFLRIQPSLLDIELLNGD
ncbi:hypothetical protein RDI58_003897 [Solanum bulbocastanum]|uniref:Uncharacterized protein n=1 Tax=Solanum bulbocastanum TaxID=147425 RepID=A0AAN8YL80_SOLBU